MSFYLLDNAQPVTQQWGYPRRGASLSGTCIIHTAECAIDLDGADSSAENCANFIRTRSDYGSYHTLVDSDSIIEMAPYEYETWQDSQTNPWAVGLSAAVQADNWHTIPADRRDRIYRNLASAAADFVIYMGTKGIKVPLRRISGQEARNRVPGFCAHGDSGIDRHDPGAQFDWALFFKYTQQALGGAAIAPQSTTTKPNGFLMALTDAQQKLILDRITRYVDAPVSAVPDKTWEVTVVHGGTHSVKTELVLARKEAAALRTAITALAKNPNLTADQITEAVKAGLAEAVVDVDVNVNGKAV